MKLAIISIAFLASCASTEPIQVQRESLTVSRIETQYRYPIYVFHVIWIDKRGIEYTESVLDTTSYVIGKNYVQLLRR